MKARAQIAAAAHCLTAQGNHMERDGIIVSRPAGVQAVIRPYAEIGRACRPSSVPMPKSAGVRCGGSRSQAGSSGSMPSA